MRTGVCAVLGLLVCLLAAPEAHAFMGVDGMESEIHADLPPQP
jgi:hypothetical protein